LNSRLTSQLPTPTRTHHRFGSIRLDQLNLTTTTFEMAALPSLTRRKTMLFDEELQRADSMESLSVDPGLGPRLLA